MKTSTTFACLALAFCASCDPTPPAPTDASRHGATSSAPRASVMPSSTASSEANTLKVVGADGEVLAEFETLTRNFADDEGLPSRARCAPDEAAWLAGGKALRAGIVLCLSEESVRAPAVVSITDRGRSFVHTWWEGSGFVSVAVDGARITVDGTIALQQFTHPASFMGGVPDEPARIQGTAKLTF